MTTEILGFIIIVGAVIVLLARRQINKAEDDPEVLEAATGRLRYELEQSADEIINRMTDHVDRLERLLREADRKSELLEQQIAQLQVLQMNMSVQNNAPRQDVQQVQSVRPAGRATQAGQAKPAPVAAAAQPRADYTTEVDSLLGMQQTPAAVVDFSNKTTPAANNVNTSNTSSPVNTTNAAENSLSEADRRAWEYIREASMELEAQYEAQANAMQDTQQSDALQQAVDIQSGKLDSLVSGYQEAQPANDDELSINTEVAAEQARKLMAEGYSMEDIAKATGLGIGAVQLIKQLQERK